MVQPHTQLRESSPPVNASIEVGKEDGQASLPGRVTQRAPSDPGPAGTQSCPDAQPASLVTAGQASLAPLHMPGVMIVPPWKLQRCGVVSTAGFVSLHEPSGLEPPGTTGRLAHSLFVVDWCTKSCMPPQSLTL